jgi:PEP-CTERM motif-containing protein
MDRIRLARHLRAYALAVREGGLMKRLCWLAVAAAFGVGLASSAAVAGPITYTYTPAAPFNMFGYYGTSSTFTPNPGGNYSCTGGVGECEVNGYFTVAAPLNDPALTNITDSVLTYSFTDGNTTWTNNGGPCPTAMCVAAYNFTSPGGNSGIIVKTDPGGGITSWQVFLQGGGVGDLSDYYLYTYNFPGNVVDQSNDQNPLDHPDNIGDAFVMNDAGSWSDPVPEPSSLLLLGSGLLGFAARRRKRLRLSA